MNSTIHLEALTETGAKLLEFAAKKALAISQRGTYRDYVDIYFLLKEGHVTIERIFAIAQKKYPKEFNERLFLEQLLYMDDVRDVPVDFLRDPVDRQQIQATLHEQCDLFGPERLRITLLLHSYNSTDDNDRGKGTWKRNI